MISKDLAAQRAKLIKMDKAACQVVPSDIEQKLDAHGNSTIYLSAIDKDGNIVSLIQSNYAGYGTGMVAPGLGFSFHNRGAGFDLTPGLPNSLAGRKRPLHTIIPAFMEKDDMHIGFGIMGGWNQAQAHAQFVSNVVDFGMNVQAAMEQPRFTERDLRRVRCGDGRNRSRIRPRRANQARPPDSAPGAVLFHRRPGRGRGSGQHPQSQLCRRGSTIRRRSHPAGTEHSVVHGFPRSRF